MNIFLPDIWRMDRKDVKLICPNCETIEEFPKLSLCELSRLVKVTRYLKLRQEYEQKRYVSKEATSIELNGRIAFLQHYLSNNKTDLAKSPFLFKHCINSKLILLDDHYFQTVDDEPWSGEEP